MVICDGSDECFGEHHKGHQGISLHGRMKKWVTEMAYQGDSYSSLERRLLWPIRSELMRFWHPLVRILARLGISPNVVSLSQIPAGLSVVWLIPKHPRLALALYVITLAMDGLDGALARHTGQVSPFGALIDQFSDHVREMIVVLGLVWLGALHPLLGGLFPFLLLCFNLTIALCNLYQVPIPLALKHYLTMYPGLFLYLWFDINVMNIAVSISVLLMCVVIIQGLLHLRGALT